MTLLGGPPEDLATACSDWLALRADADSRARDDGSAHLLAELLDHLMVDVVEEVEVVDLGAGTGANHRYLAPRLGLPQRWTALDHDAEALAHPGHGDADRVVADVEDLVEVLEPLTGQPPGRPVLLTCSALLDVLTTRQLTALAEAIVRFRCPALLALTVTGEVGWSPPEPEDALLREAFDGHQRRAGRPGPQAAEELARRVSEAGLIVRSASTPWRLGGDPDLLRRWLVERVDAAIEQGPRAAGHLSAWRDRRVRQLADGELAVQVGHVDLLILPPGSSRPAPPRSTFPR